MKEHRAFSRTALSKSMGWFLFFGIVSLVIPEICCAQALRNPGFEEDDLAGWTVLTGLDSMEYATCRSIFPEETYFRFDDLVPQRVEGGYLSPYCAGFPASGTWRPEPIDHHHRKDEAGLAGQERGKAALRQSVELEPGRYAFGAYLRTASGAFWSAGFSLGYATGKDVPYAHDSSTGIIWTRHNLAHRHREIGTREQRGEWAWYETETFEVPETGPYTFFIRFNFINNHQMVSRWEVDEAAILDLAGRKRLAEETGTVSFRLVDIYDNPIADAEVRLFPGELYSMSDAWGGVVFRNVPPGTYRVQLTDPALDLLAAEPEEIAVTQGANLGGEIFSHRRHESYNPPPIRTISAYNCSAPMETAPAVIHTVYPAPDQLIADCADDDEKYLTDNLGSVVRKGRRLFQNARAVSRDGSFSYTFPVSRKLRELWIAFEASGECHVTVNGTVVLDQGDSGYGLLCGHEIHLTDPAYWRDGRVTVTFRDSDPKDGGGPAVEWIEVGSTTRYRERLKNVVWDTTRVLWNFGVWDGNHHEFRGEETTVRVGRTRPEEMARTGEFTFLWDQKVHPNRRYYVIAGYMGGSAGFDLNHDGIFDYTSRIRGLEPFEVDVTDHVREFGNSIKFYTDGTLDFVALVEVLPGAIVAERDLRVSFEGTPEAEAFSRVLHNTWFWVLNMQFDWTGFVDASPIRGNWYQQYWPIDIAFALREILFWGYMDQAVPVARLVAEVAWHGHQSNRSGGSDNTGGNYLAMDLAELVRRLPDRPEIQEKLFQAVRDHAEQIIRDVDASPFDLVRGTNWENAGNLKEGPCYAISTNMGAYQVLLKAAQIARERGSIEDAERWEKAAMQLRSTILDRLVFEEDTVHNDTYTYPAGTWKYGLNTEGKRFEDPLCAWMWGGSSGTSLYGLIDPDNEIREIYTRTALAGRELYDTQPHGFLIGYGPSYEGWDLMLGAVALSDLPSYVEAMSDKTLKYCSDYREDLGATVAELSRWALGSPGSVEDNNLVGAAGFIATARYITGIDDLLYEGNQLRIVPRIPPSWTRATVNRWPARYLAGDTPSRFTTDVSYRYLRSSEMDTFRIATSRPVSGLRIRLGVFPEDMTGYRVLLEGLPMESEEEISGEGKWIWVTLDTEESEKTIQVRR